MEHPETLRPSRGPRILVVDDDGECRSALREILEECSYIVTEARDGKTALDQMTLGLHPALVILDLNMPVMSGHELLQIVDSYERLSRLPVLVISGTPRSQFASGGTVKGFMSKPLDMSKLLDAVSTCISPHEKLGGRGGLSGAPD